MVHGQSADKAEGLTTEAQGLRREGKIIGIAGECREKLSFGQECGMGLGQVRGADLRSAATNGQTPERPKGRRQAAFCRPFHCLVPS